MQPKKTFVVYKNEGAVSRWLKKICSGPQETSMIQAKGQVGLKTEGFPALKLIMVFTFQKKKKFCPLRGAGGH